jgi:hypothetical protein
MGGSGASPQVRGTQHGGDFSPSLKNWKSTDFLK